MLERRFRLGRGVTLGLHQSIRKANLQFDLFPTERRCGGQGRDQVKGAGELGYSLDQSRALQRPLPGLAP